MLNENIRPNNYTYESCIQYYCEKGNVADAKQLISRQRLYINTEIFKLLMWGHYQNGDLQTALNMFKRKKGIRENNEIYTVLMSIYAAQNDIDRIIETIQICNSKCVNLSNENILNVIYVLAINNYIKDIDKIIFYLNKYKEQLSFNGIQILIKLIYLNHISIITPILSCIKDTLISEILIKHMILSNMNICNIERMCNFLETEKLCSKPLLRALFHSYSKNDENLCFSLLEMCKQHYSVKPHYFWPLLIKKAELYDFQGILNIIKVMINHFEVSPCFDTIYEYVLPFTFECLLTTKNRLITLGVDETILNNALLLNFLEDGKLRMALVHMYRYPDKYMYTIIQRKLRKCLIVTNQIEDFIYISTNLMDTDPYTQKFISVPMDKQLLDFLYEYPLSALFVKKIIEKLRNRRDYKITKLENYDFINSCMDKNILIKYKIHYL